MTEQQVLVERRGAVQVITLNRPEAKNALNEAVALAVAAAVDELDADPELRVGVLTGAGGTFSAGMDLKAFLRGERPGIEGRGLCGITETPPRKPMIGAVEGWALAGGFELLLACDLVVAAEDARFGVPEVTRSLIAAGGAALRLPQRVPAALALELLLTGQPVGAPRAYEMGLVNRLVPARHRAGRRRRAGPGDRGERPARRGRDQADRAGQQRVGLVGGVAQAGRDHGAGLRLRGRQGGLDRVRREAQAGLEGPLTGR